MLIPEMKKEGYDGGFCIGVTAASSTIGPIIPPSMTMVIYASITSMSVGRLFLAGVVPGLAIGLALMVLVAFMSRRRNYPRRERIPWAKRGPIVAEGLPALVAPVIIIGGIVTGVSTATEAGVVACVYGILVGMFLYRELKVSDLMNLLSETVESTAVPVFILATAGLFGWLLAYYGLGELLVDAMQALDLGPLGVLLFVFVVVMILGLFIEGLVIIIVFVPVFMPLIPAFGLDPLHFALIMIVTQLIGAVTPPVGLLLFIAASVGKTPVREAVVWPFVFTMMVVVILMILMPGMVTWLPNLLMPEV
jgi:tripartite ATP-independent transporter DctM subunit